MSSQVLKTVYLVRHGQSVDNVSPVFQSDASPLSPAGHKQAEVIAKRAATLSFEALIASPLARTRQTAEYISRACGKDIEFNDLFKERRRPISIDGKPWDDEQASTTWREWEKSLYTPGLKVEDGENYDEILTRAQACLDFLKNRPEKAVLVVTHGYFLCTIVSRVLLGDSLTSENMYNFQRSAQMQNTGITVLQYKDAFEEEPSWRLWTYNDHSHFAE